MQTMRDVASAWLVVAVLGLGVVTVWGWGDSSPAAGEAVACKDLTIQDQTTAELSGVEVPRTGWHPVGALAGLPETEKTRTTSYEAAEERNLMALEAPSHELAVMAHGSNTSLNPTSMC